MSREAELYKDKIEVSLDGRQIFYLFFGGAVIVGLVFVLGVMVGRRVEARGHVDRARVAATVDPLAALDRLEGGGGAGLSFQGALRGTDVPVSDVEKQIAAMQKADGKAMKVEKAIAKVEVKPDAKPEAKPKHDDATNAKADANTEGAKKGEGKREDKPEADAKDAVKSDGKRADAKDAKQPEDKRADDKEARKSDDKSEKRASDGDDSKSDRKDEKKPRFTLQLSAFQDKHEAESYLDSIKSAGYQAYVTEGAVDGKQYYRVRLGSYRSMDAANEAKTEFEKSSNKSAIVTRL